MRALHLDFKGIVPSEKKLLQWLEWFRKCGFDCLFPEYDCRVPWDAWHGAGAPLFTKDAVKRIAAYAESLGFEIVPLIQVHGHLEWILKHDAYSFLRENGTLNELCPCHEESIPKMRQWIDEIAALHPHASKIHLGCDETWHLGSCSRCRKAVENDPAQRGNMGLFIDHAASLCRYAWEEKHLRPMIWDDMFCRDNGKSLKYCGAFPRETVFIHWKYGRNTTEHLDLIRPAGFEVWGASAIRCGWINHHWKALNILGDRLDNIADWEKTGLPVLHTTWGRPNNLWNLYGPWEALIPPFLAAGNPAKWAVHPWRLFINALDSALLSKDRKRLEELAGEALRLPAADKMEEQAKIWYHIGIRYELLHAETLEQFQTERCLAVLGKYGCRDPKRIAEFAALSCSSRNRKTAWEKDLAEFWRRNELSDFEEYLDTRRAGIYCDARPEI